MRFCIVCDATFVGCNLHPHLVCNVIFLGCNLYPLMRRPLHHFRPSPLCTHHHHGKLCFFSDVFVLFRKQTFPRNEETEVSGRNRSFERNWSFVLNPVQRHIIVWHMPSRPPRMLFWTLCLCNHHSGMWICYFLIPRLVFFCPFTRWRNRSFERNGRFTVPPSPSTRTNSTFLKDMSVVWLLSIFLLFFDLFLCLAHDQI